MISAVVRAGWLNLRRDRAALMLSFIVPVVFFSIFAVMFGSRGRSATPKVTLAVVDEDQSTHSKRLIEALRNESALTILLLPEGDEKSPRPLFTSKSAEAAVRAGDMPVALIIPKGFGSSRISFDPTASAAPTLKLVADSSDPIAPQLVNGLLQKTVMMAVPQMFMRSGIDQVDQWSGGLTPKQRATLDSNIAVMEVAPQQTPADGASGGLVNVHVADVLGEKKKNPLIAFYAAGIGVMFLLFTATGAGGALLEENENGTLDRLLTTRLTMTNLLLGKLAYLTTLGLAQLIVMFVWAALAFKLELMSHLGGFFVMAVPTAIASSAFGLLLAAVSRTRAQLSALSTMAVLSMSAIGGSMFPRFLMPESLQKAGLITFNAWALEGFTKVFWREEPIVNLWPQVAVLLGSGVLFFVVARQLTRRWEVV